MAAEPDDGAVGGTPAAGRGSVRNVLCGCLVGAGLLAASLAPPASGAVPEAVTTALPAVAPREFKGDLSRLPQAPLSPAKARERPYRPLLRPPVKPKTQTSVPGPEAKLSAAASLAPMPAPTRNFEGLARTDSCTGGQCGNGTPPDTNGEVGPNHYIQAVNSAYGIYDKNGTLLASFTEDQLWSGDASICNGQSQGDPVVVYDALADRWILTHFAFGFSGSHVTAPYYQCIAVSKTADPVAGGWWLYPVRVDDGSHPWLNDYAKFGIWTDCLYMSANEFTSTDAYKGTLFASFSRADMYAGAPLTASIGYLTGTSAPFSMVPSHLGGQAGATVPAGTPNYFVSESRSLYAFEVRPFVAGPNCGANGTMGAPTIVSQVGYTFFSGAIVPQPGTTNKLDAIDDRVMQKVQYRKLGAQESLWVAHTFRTSSSGVTGIQWAQLDVTGGAIATTPVQQQKYDPADGRYRWMPSIAVDRQGNMAVGYSTSNGTAPNYPGIAYAGRLAGDPADTLPQTEWTLIAGGGSQTGNCGGAPCHRWGDYTAMSADPADDCTFWLTNEYYPAPFDANTIAWHTRIGSFRFPSCTPVNRSADLAVTKTDGVTAVAPGAPISYTIVVTNHGPFAVTGATLTDTLPAAITGAAWTCAASAGSSCPAAGAGSIATSALNLLAGGTATFAIGGTVSPSASGTLANTATVAVPAGFTDPVPGNNSASDVDAVGAVIAAPTIVKAFGSAAIVVGETTLLTITVSNPNPSAALTGVGFTDALPAGVAAADTAFPFCGGTVSVAGGTIALAGGTLPAAGQCAIPVTVTGAQAQAAAWTNVIPSVSSIEGGTNATPATAGITVGRAATTISIASDLPDPSAAGQPYTVSWSVVALAPGAGAPGGSVTVSDGTAQCTGTLPATGCQLVSGTPGAKTLTATYAGDGNFLGSVSSGVAHNVVAPPPVLLGAVSRKQHGAVGSFDLPLSANASSPTTEPRAAGAGASHRRVFTFDKSITAATVAVTEGTAVAGAAVLDGNDVVVDLSGVGNAQYVTVTLSAVAAADGGFGGSATARIGFLAGDVNGSRSVTLSDLLIVNAALAQIVTATNYLADVNLSGTLTLSDLLFVNARLTQALP